MFNISKETVIKSVIRLCFGMLLLYRVYPETGPYTTVLLFYIIVNIEALFWLIVKTIIAMHLVAEKGNKK